MTQKAFKKCLFNLICLLLFVSVQGCAQTKQKGFDAMIYTTLSHTVPTITIDSFKSVKDKVILLDTRSKEEYKTSHIKNAKWIGYDSFKQNMVDDLPKDTPIVVYCSVGYRSEKIGEKLLNLGFKNIYNLYGGIFNWVNRSNPVYKSDTVATDDIHPYSDEWGVWLTKGNKVYKED